MNSASSDSEIYVLAVGNKPHLRIDFGRNDVGIVTVASLTRDAPLQITLNGAMLAERNISAARKPCGCPDSSESVIGGVHVRHRQDCMHGEPRQYVWQYAGMMYTGNLADYARHWESLDPEAQHALTLTGDELRTWDPDSYRLAITGDMDDEGCFHYHLSTGEEWLIVDIDSRA